MRIDLVKCGDLDITPGKHEYIDFFTMQSDKYEAKYTGRPFVCVEGDNRYLRSEIHNWFTSLNAEYSIFFDHALYMANIGAILWALDIPNDDIALMFKLTWL